jgi:hypothetical protein
MCGIAGYLISGQEFEDVDRILRMTRSMATRGPDDEGIVVVDRRSRTATAFQTRETAEGAGAGLPLERWLKSKRAAFFRAVGVSDLPGTPPLNRSRPCPYVDPTAEECLQRPRHQGARDALAGDVRVPVVAPLRARSSSRGITW